MHKSPFPALCSRLRTDKRSDDSQVIVTSYLFPKAKFDLERLQRLAKKVGKERLVVDVRFVTFTTMRLSRQLTVLVSHSCRRRETKWVVAMNRWQDLTDMEVNQGVSAFHCFLVSRADPDLSS